MQFLEDLDFTELNPVVLGFFFLPRGKNGLNFYAYGSGQTGSENENRFSGL